ncbi:hypothetical protein C414_000080189 [Campylobacter jejuni subsp. jejuni 414]|nr:hypothetical protein C414_000080189 [Campylobacter jejuni subsp. jejuni 414]
MKKFLAKSTDIKIKSILFGTLIMQSSTLVFIITSRYIGIIFGANLGNTASS